jgi:hypothetical protein
METRVNTDKLIGALVSVGQMYQDGTITQGDAQPTALCLLAEAVIAVAEEIHNGRGVSLQNRSGTYADHSDR